MHQVYSHDHEKWLQHNEKALIAQSRSFSLPILALSDEFKRPIMVEYNLNKLIDTVEDSPKLNNTEKTTFLNNICDALARGEVDHGTQKHLMSITPKAESYVVRYYDDIMALYNTLSPAEQKLSTHWTTIMAKGMAKFRNKPILNMQDLNQYCYYVAGSVGEYLTEVLKLNGKNVDSKHYAQLRQHAIPFGQFLQKLNIIRDYFEDTYLYQHPFWPKELIQRHPNHIDALNELCLETLRNDIPSAIEYHKWIPKGNESYTNFIRFILKSGMEYLKLLINNDAVFSKQKIKLSRFFIKSLYKNVSNMSAGEFASYCEATQLDLGAQLEHA